MVTARVGMAISAFAELAPNPVRITALVNDGDDFGFVRLRPVEDGMMEVRQEHPVQTELPGMSARKRGQFNERCIKVSEKVISRSHFLPFVETAALRGVGFGRLKDSDCSHGARF